MTPKKKFIASLIGTLVVLLCCATPVLVILFGAVGLGVLTGYLDFVLIPALLIFLLLTFYSYNKWKKTNNNKDSCCS
jgi:mercuric ion transport protein